MPSEHRVPMTWESRDGLDSSVHFEVSRSGVSRTTGKNWSATKKVGKGLGSIAVLAGLLTGRISYGPAALSQHYLSGRSKDRQFMRWKDIRKVDVNKNNGIISLCDKNETELRLHCTFDVFDPVLRIIRERATSIPKNDPSMS